MSVSWLNPASTDSTGRVNTAGNPLIRQSVNSSSHDHERLTFRHSGRDFRLTDVHGDVVKGVLA